MQNKPELLAPAGSFEALQAAVQGDADAVYFGLEQLNMRARASGTFTIYDLPEIVNICKHNGLKCYLTLNTIIYNHDLALMRKIVDQACEHRVDAIIAMDPAVMQYARDKQMPLHISTQANICNIESVAFYARYADAMVLARELTLNRIYDISRLIYVIIYKTVF